MPALFSFDRRSSFLISVVLACFTMLLVFAQGAGASEAGADAGVSATSKPKRIYACVTLKFSTLNRTTRRGRCESGEKKISWNVKGRRGKRGAAGARGATGEQGPRGLAGADGAQGPAGPAGAAGATGANGANGAPGVAGATGATGAQGSADTAQQILDKLLTVDGPGSGLNADLLDGLHAEDFWQVTGNTSTDPATDFLGTTDSQPLNFRVNNTRALRLEPALNGAAPAPNVIGGSPDNAVSGGAFSATISGGGRADSTDSTTANRVLGSGGTVGGGRGNVTAGSDSTVSGGFRNVAGDNETTIAGGVSNVANARWATVSGGTNNSATNTGASVGGGILNSATRDYANTSGGNSNLASGIGSNVSGGLENTASNNFSSVGGGTENVASGTTSAVGGGSFNSATGSSSSIAGGQNNLTTGIWSSVSGGINNVASGIRSSVVGSNSVAAANGSFAFGNQANVLAAHTGAMLFSDTSGSAFDSVANDEFAVRAAGGFRFRTSGGASTGCDIPAGSGVFSCTSDRNTKEAFEPVVGEDVLDKLAGIPVTTWKFKTDESGARHAGPMAQDFYAAFGLGTDNKSISTTDVDGVALAAIKALSDRTEQQGEKIAELEARLAALED